jgi:hypothetical protein
LLQVLQPAFQFTGPTQPERTATEQITQRRKMQHRAVVIAALEIRHAQPAGMLRARQGDVEQAQVFGQTLIIGLCNQLGGRFQTHLSLARASW